MKRFVKRLINYLIVFAVLQPLMLLIAPRSIYAAETGKSFWVEYIDVGQGDSALIQCDGHYMMIDGGPAKASDKIYTVLKNKGISQIDLMIATHPDEDHIGGLSGALNYAKVGTVFSPVTAHDTKTFNNLLKYIGKQGKSITVPTAGDVYSLGSAKIYIAGPVVSSTETNNESIVALVVYGDNSFLFMGDAEEEEEYSIIKKYSGLDCDVLKVGHHGSNSSTSKVLLKETKPKYAVISVGTNNTYGHPTQKTLDSLANANAQIYRTDLQGDIIICSDGKKLTIETQKNASSYELTAGEGSKSTGTNNVGNDVVIPSDIKYVVNTNSKKFHIPTCDSVKEMSAKNMQFSTVTAEALVNSGYKPCKRCCPSVASKDESKQVSANPVAASQISEQATQQTHTDSSEYYVLNNNTKKFHYPTCSSVGDISPKNRKDVNMSRDEIISSGYVPCKRCNP